MRSTFVVAAFAATSIYAQTAPAPNAGPAQAPPVPLTPAAAPGAPLAQGPPGTPFAPLPPPPAVAAPPSLATPPAAPAQPKQVVPPSPRQGKGPALGEGVVPPKGVTLPNLSSTANRFPPGVDAKSPKLQIAIAPGAYPVALTTNAAFPNRTLYIPQNVPAGVKVPIFAWENGLCYLYGRMYQAFLQEVASHGYLVVVPGPPNRQDPGRSTSDWQLESIAQARAWQNAPFTLDKTKVAVGGHSCGGGETLRNLPDVDSSEITTALIMNSAGSGPASEEVKIPMLWVHGGQTDTEDRANANFDYVAENKPELPVVLVGFQTGHLGSFWSPRGGLYAETVVHWLNGQLKGNQTEKAWFAGESASPAATRGWTVQANNYE